MVGPGNNKFMNNRGYNGGYNNARRGDDTQFQRQAVQPARPETLPDDFTGAAENVITGLLHQVRDRNVIDISNSKIRRLFSLVIPVFNRERLSANEKISKESRDALMMARVRMAYEAGRDPTVKEFIEKSKLMEYIKGIGDDREKFIRFSRYMEALVAWHRYYGDKN